MSSGGLEPFSVHHWIAVLVKPVRLTQPVDSVDDRQYWYTSFAFKRWFLQIMDGDLSKLHQACAIIMVTQRQQPVDLGRLSSAQRLAIHPDDSVLEDLETQMVNQNK